MFKTIANPLLILVTLLSSSCSFNNDVQSSKGFTGCYIERVANQDAHPRMMTITNNLWEMPLEGRYGKVYGFVINNNLFNYQLKKVGTIEKGTVNYDNHIFDPLKTPSHKHQHILLPESENRFFNIINDSIIVIFTSDGLYSTISFKTIDKKGEMQEERLYINLILVNGNDLFEYGEGIYFGYILANADGSFVLRSPVTFYFNNEPINISGRYTGELGLKVQKIQ